MDKGEPKLEPNNEINLAVKFNNSFIIENESFARFAIF